MDIRNTATGVFAVAIYIAAFALWLYAIGHCMVNGKAFMLALDFTLPPVGTIHGLLLLIGLA